MSLILGEDLIHLMFLAVENKDDELRNDQRKKY
jgi:hypothetical protein